MKAVKLASGDQERTRLRSKCKQLLSRAEEIKKSETWTLQKSKPTLVKVPSSERTATKAEQIILLEGSKLHGFIFPPWKDDPDESNFNDDKLYKCVPHASIVPNGCDTHINRDPTDLELSDAQREIFAGWKRPHETFDPPPETQHDEYSMISTNEIDLVQDITTDCSVVASLCAGTARALKGHGKLLASTIHPYDQVNLRPRVSKNGKYIFRLHFNGCFRKVIIDDRLPTSNTPRSLHVVDRKNPHLLWPALIEKAYLKVRGGYDFPGSNSGTDLWVISGWIPEQVFLQR
jgi:calpain-7